MAMPLRGGGVKGRQLMKIFLKKKKVLTAIKLEGGGRFKALMARPLNKNCLFCGFQNSFPYDHLVTGKSEKKTLKKKI